jgi:hypothetical protein
MAIASGVAKEMSMESRKIGGLRGALLLVLVLSVSATAQQSYISLDLYVLGSYYYTVPGPADIKAKKPFKSSIPATIRAHDGRKVAVNGFMIPYDMSTNVVKEFMLVASYDACGFGEMPARANDWVDVSVRGKGTYFNDGQITVTGILSVGEQFDADGYLVSIYRLDAEAVH